MRTRPGPDLATSVERPVAARSSGVRHVHWFRYSGPDAFSGSSLYACRCGEVRPGL